MSSSHCSFELKIMCDTFCCFPQFFNLWTFKKFTIITLWVKTFKVNYEFLHSWTVRNQKDTMRGGEMTKVKREEKKDLVAWFLLGMIIFLWSVHLHYSLQWLEGSPERTPRQNDVGYWLETTQRTIGEESKFYPENRFFKKRQIFQFRRNKRVLLSPASESSLTNTLWCSLPSQGQPRLI